jgi:hypothetical protein
MPRSEPIVPAWVLLVNNERIVSSRVSLGKEACPALKDVEQEQR